MSEEDFTFEVAPFPPAASSKAVRDLATYLAALPTDAQSPFVAFAAALPVADMLATEIAHARDVLREFPAFGEVRRRVVPRLLSDERFWQAYFALLAIETRHRALREADDPSARATTRVVLRLATPGVADASASSADGVGGAASGAGSAATASRTMQSRATIPPSLCVGRASAPLSDASVTRLMARDDSTAISRERWRACVNEMSVFTL
jgi:hypothetical protein